MRNEVSPHILIEFVISIFSYDFLECVCINRNIEIFRKRTRIFLIDIALIHTNLILSKTTVIEWIRIECDVGRSFRIIDILSNPCVILFCDFLYGFDCRFLVRIVDFPGFNQAFCPCYKEISVGFNLLSVCSLAAAGPCPSAASLYAQ